MLNKIETSIPLKLKNYVAPGEIQSSKKLFKSGQIELNGVKIQISRSDTVGTLATKINAKKFGMGVEATVISTKSGLKLLLKSKSDTLNLTDHKGVFANLYKNKDLGTNKNASIQVIRNSTYYKPNDVSLNYNNQVKSFSNSNIRADIISESNKLELLFASRYETNNPANVSKITMVNKTTSIRPSAMNLIEIPAETIGIIDILDTIDLREAPLMIDYIENIIEHRAPINLQQPVIITDNIELPDLILRETPVVTFSEIITSTPIVPELLEASRITDPTITIEAIESEAPLIIINDEDFLNSVGRNLTSINPTVQLEQETAAIVINDLDFLSPVERFTNAIMPEVESYIISPLETINPREIEEVIEEQDRLIREAREINERTRIRELEVNAELIVNQAIGITMASCNTPMIDPQLMANLVNALKTQLSITYNLRTVIEMDQNSDHLTQGLKTVLKNQQTLYSRLPGVRQFEVEPNTINVLRNWIVNNT